jgi:hypothetical protein
MLEKIAKSSQLHSNERKKDAYILKFVDIGNLHKCQILTEYILDIV